MVDPYEAVIALAKDDPDLYAICSGQIAMEHKYGQDTGEWDQESNSLIFRPIGGLPDIYIGMQRVQIEAYCYGDTPHDCSEVYDKLIAFTRQPRRTVGVTEGIALVHYVLTRANARLINDEEIRPHGMPVYLVLIEAAVAEDLVNT